jgi:hypothetical protein
MIHMGHINYSTSHPDEFVIHPWIHNPSNTWKMEDAIRPVTIPDVSPAHLLRLNEGLT